MNQWIELNTKIANDSLAALKQLGELNVKTTEAFLAQQKELTESFAATAEKNIEKLTAVKEPKEFLELQNELLQSSVSSAVGNWKKTYIFTYIHITQRPLGNFIHTHPSKNANPSLHDYCDTKTITSSCARH